MGHESGPRRAAATLGACAIAALLSMAAAPAAGAQAWIYPSFQQPHIVNREFTAAIASGGYDGTSFIFQWREQLAPRSQFVFDGGIASSVNGHAVDFLGGQYGYQLLVQHDSEPLEVMGLVGATFAFGGHGTLAQIPFTAAVGHRFALGNGAAITPYLDPRVSIDFCTVCHAEIRGGGRGSATGVGGGVGIGANLELSPRVSVRLDTAIRGSSLGGEDNTIGFGVAWSPAGLRAP